MRRSFAGRRRRHIRPRKGGRRRWPEGTGVAFFPPESTLALAAEALGAAFLACAGCPSRREVELEAEAIRGNIMPDNYMVDYT